MYDLIKIPVRDSLRCFAFHRDAGACQLGSNRAEGMHLAPSARRRLRNNDFVPKLLISIPGEHTSALTVYSPGREVQFFGMLIWNFFPLFYEHTRSRSAFDKLYLNTLAELKALLSSRDADYQYFSPVLTAYQGIDSR